MLTFFSQTCSAKSKEELKSIEKEEHDKKRTRCTNWKEDSLRSGYGLKACGTKTRMVWSIVRTKYRTNY